MVLGICIFLLVLDSFFGLCICMRGLLCVVFGLV